MNLGEILTLFDQQERQAYEFPDTRKEILPYITRHLRPAPGMSLILHSQLDATNADLVIQEQIADFSRMALPVSWKVYQYDQPADLGERLKAAGFKPEDGPPDAIMVLDTQEAPASLLAPQNIEVRRITHPFWLEDVIQVEQQVWGGKFEWIRDRMGLHMEIPGYLSIFVAYVDENPACAGWTYFDLKGDFAGLWGGSTVPEQRGKGCYTAVLAARLQDAIQRGYRYLVVDASPMSRPILEKHGFQVITYAMSYEWKIDLNRNAEEHDC